MTSIDLPATRSHRGDQPAEAFATELLASFSEERPTDPHPQRRVSLAGLCQPLEELP